MPLAFLANHSNRLASFCMTTTSNTGVCIMFTTIKSCCPYKFIYRCLSFCSSRFSYFKIIGCLYLWFDVEINILLHQITPLACDFVKLVNTHMPFPQGSLIQGHWNVWSVCSLPAEYCEFGPDFEKCKPWLIKNAPELYPDLVKGEIQLYFFRTANWERGIPIIVKSQDRLGVIHYIRVHFLQFIQKKWT
jgi:hypothetical protein